MTIIHELELENKDNVDSNVYNMKKTKQNRTPTAGMMVSEHGLLNTPSKSNLETPKMRGGNMNYRSYLNNKQPT